MARRERWRDLSLMASSMITIIATTVIAASLPAMSEAYAAEPDAGFLVKVALTLPALAVALAGPAAGALADRWGRKRLLVASLLLYGAAGTAGSYLPSLHSILASRFVLGVAVAGISTSATALIADVAEPGRLGSLLGRQSLFMAAGNILFVSLGGVLAAQHWRLPFAIYAIGFLLVPGVLLAVADPARGGAGAGAGGGAAGAVAAGAGAVAAPVPRGRAAVVYAVGFVNMVLYFMVPVYLPFHLRAVAGSGAAGVGGMLAIVGLSWGLSSTLYPRVRRHLDFPAIVAAAFAVMGAAYVLLAHATGVAMVGGALVLVGLGLGAIVPNLNAWLISFVPPARKGRAIGGLLCSVFLGQFCSPILTRPLGEAIGPARAYLAGGALLLALAGGYGALALLRAAAGRRAAAAAALRRAT